MQQQKLPQPLTTPKIKAEEIPIFAAPFVLLSLFHLERHPLRRQCSPLCASHARQGRWCATVSYPAAAPEQDRFSNAFRSPTTVHASRSSAATSELLMPAMSPTMTEGTLTEWKFKVGDSFKAGDVLMTLETDKASMDVEAQDDGILGKVLVSCSSYPFSFQRQLDTRSAEELGGDWVSSMN